MPLADFIQENLEAILADWEAFARTILPATKGMNTEKLRDHARDMLMAIARDMQTQQSGAEQKAKSEGRRLRPAPHDDSPAEVHTTGRLSDGFTLTEVVSEYRALRASVIRLWTRSVGSASRAHLDEMTRFNEAIDEALYESITRYTARIDQGRDLLLGALGHDLRNPLGAVLHSAQLLLEVDDPDGARTKSAARRIMNSSMRMKELVANLLDFASTKLGDSLPLSVVRMDLGEVCRSAAEEIVASHPDRAIHVDCRGELTGDWDPARIAQMLSNLLGNAVKHGVADLPILVSVAASDGHARIEIHNKGSPIPEDLRGTLFQPLTRGAIRSRESTIERGVGLGLYIAAEIAKSHGGKLELTRSDQSGTTFAVTLPRKLSSIVYPTTESEPVSDQ